jgi:23S rRNA (uracil1939-C5)-methyltransferase
VSRARLVPDGARVLELHAGVGAIGLGLVARARHVALNEVSPDARAGLAMGLAALGDDARRRASVLGGPAADNLGALDDADVVVCDPPRHGLGRPLLERLAADPPPRLAVVSCDLDAFLAEARTLLDGGRTRLSALVSYALLPFTEHVETAALFERGADRPAV